MKPRVPVSLDGLVSAARRDGPSAAKLSRASEEIAARLTSSASSRPASLLRGVLRSRTAVVVVAAAVASGAVFGVFANTRSAGDRPPPEVTPRETASPPSPVAESPSPALPDNLAPKNATDDRVPEIPTIDVRSLPELKMPPEIHKTNPDSVTAAAPEDSEGALLQRAHAAISTDPAQALLLTDTHLRRFPKGMLAQEREVLAIEALAHLGRAEQARSRAAILFATYPSSAYRRRVDDALASGGTR